MAYLLRPGEHRADEEVESSRDVETAVTMIEEERRRRISFEVYPDLMHLQDLMPEEDDEAEGSLGDAELDMLLERSKQW